MLQDINVLLKRRQSSYGFDCNQWDVKTSEISGKGVFANQNFEPGDVIFKEIPLVTGPRAIVQPAGCVTCLKMNLPLRACQNGCRLPVCSNECESADTHQQECQLLNNLATKKEEHWSPFLYRAVTPLRCLLLPEEGKQIIKGLCANKTNKHLEVSLLKKEIQNELTPEDETFLKLSCSVLNGAAFEIRMDKGVLDLALRGLYPLAGMMNHSCTPNTQHFFDLKNNVHTMFVVASNPIKKGAEITTAYCPLLWSTMTRRQFLFLTKEFLCSCPRCQDPTEFGTYFSAHQCTCKGFILPVSPLDVKSGWKCQSCSKTMSLNEVLLIESSLLKAKHCNGLHKMNYLNFQVSLETIWKTGSPNKPYSEIPVENLEYKEKMIGVVIDLNNRLHLGESLLKGNLLFELHKTLKEKKRRKIPIDEELLKKSFEDGKRIIKTLEEP